jgi:hypothetical protein
LRFVGLVLGAVPSFAIRAKSSDIASFALPNDLPNYLPNISHLDLDLRNSPNNYTYIAAADASMISRIVLYLFPPQ